MKHSRRAALGMLASVPAFVAGAASTVPGASGYDPRRTAEGGIKITSDLDTRRNTPWWYDLALYAIRDGAAPQLLLSAEGCECYAARRQPDGSYHVRNVTVTCFKDAATGEWLDEFANPFTGERNTVRPNLIQGGTLIYLADGSGLLRDNSDLKASEIAPSGNRQRKPVPAGSSRWIELGDRVCWLRTGVSAGAFQPLMEATSVWADRGSFFDPAVTRVDVNFSSTTLTPWLAWMEMQGAPGHLMWYAAGSKLRSLDALPAAYRERAEKLAPGRLAVDPFG